MEKAGVRLASLADAILTLNATSGSERRPHHASLGAEGGAGDDGALGAGDEGHNAGDFLGLLEAFQKRTGACPFKELLFHLRGGHAALPGNEIPGAPGGGGAGQY